MRLEAAGSLVGYVVYDDTHSLFQVADAVSTDGRIHHIAITYDENGDRRLRGWVDGILIATGWVSVGSYVGDAAGIAYLGCYHPNLYAVDGAVAWVRFSDTVRYADTFIPPSRLNPPAVDSNTVAQWNFDDGSGTTLTDSSGNGNHGTITDGVWEWFSEDYMVDSLAAWYDMEEESGTRYDAHNSADLTDNNTVTRNDGAPETGYAAQFASGNLEYLSRPDTAIHSTGDISFTLATYAYLDALGDQIIVAKGDGATLEYSLEYSGTTFCFNVGDGTSTDSVCATEPSPAVTETYYFLAGWHNAIFDTIGVQVDGLDYSAAYSAGGSDGVAPFYVGHSGSDYYDGRVDSLGLWKRYLNSDERAWVRNGGDGIQYNDFAPTPTPTPQPTPTPAAQVYTMTLPGGGPGHVIARATWGDAAILGALGMVAIISLIPVLLNVGRMFARRW